VIGISRDLTEQKELQRQILDISADERQRIGYDLHDGLGQHLSGIAFLTKAIEKDLAEAAPVQAAEVSKIIQLLNQAISQTRSLARLLSPVDVEAKGLPAALKNLADETGKIFGIEVFFLSGLDECRFNSRIGMAFYRIAQEAIHNAIHHGAAKRIEILLKQDEGEICLTVHDNGGGSDSLATPSAGMGLRIMQYRASSIEGRIIFKSEIGKGTIITCRVPIK
jgi:signal transduction histidine kinase